MHRGAKNMDGHDEGKVMRANYWLWASVMHRAAVEFRRHTWPPRDACLSCAFQNVTKSVATPVESFSGTFPFNWWHVSVNIRFCIIVRLDFIKPLSKEWLIITQVILFALKTIQVFTETIKKNSIRDPRPLAPSPLLTGTKGMNYVFTRGCTLCYRWISSEVRKI